MFLRSLYRRIEELESEIKNINNKIIFMNDVVIEQGNKLNYLQKKNKEENKEVKVIEKENNNKQTRKRKIWKGTYAQFKYDGAFEIALKDYKAGIKQGKIAEKLNLMGYITPRGLKFDQSAVSKLLNDWHQKDRYNKRQVK